MQDGNGHDLGAKGDLPLHERTKEEKEEMYGMIAQKLIQMADMYAAESGLSDAEAHQRDAGGQPTADGRLNLIHFFSLRNSLFLYWHWRVCTVIAGYVLVLESGYWYWRAGIGIGGWALILEGGYWLWRMSAVNAGYLLALEDGYWH